MLVFEAPNPGTGAWFGILAGNDGVGDTAIPGFGDDLALDVRGAIVESMAECTSLFDICLDSDENAHPAIAPAAPVAELTKPACPVPF